MPFNIPFFLKTPFGNVKSISEPDSFVSNLTVPIESDTELRPVWEWTDGYVNGASVSVERKLTDGGTFEEIDVTDPDAIEFRDTGLTADTSYTYRARAVKNGNYTAYSDEVIVKTAIYFVGEFETVLLGSGFTFPPSIPLIQLIDTEILAAKAAGIFQLSDIFTFGNLHDIQASLRNWTKDAHHGTVHGTVDFTAGVGHKGNKIDGYIDRHYTPLTDAVNFQLRECTVAFMEYQLQSNNGYQGMGCLSGGTRGISSVQFANGNKIMQLNSNSNATQLTIAANKLALWTRDYARVVQGYIDGVATGDPVTTIVGALSPYSLIEHAWNTSGTAASFSDSGKNFLFLGGLLNQTQITELTRIVHHFIDNAPAALAGTLWTAPDLPNPKEGAKGIYVNALPTINQITLSIINPNRT